MTDRHHATAMGGDDGQILLLLIGAVLILALMIAGVVDTARLYLARRSLDAVTDAAALAGSQSADLAAVYSGRTGSDVPLDPTAARIAVRRYLDAVDAATSIRGFEVDAIEVTATEVTVRSHGVVRLPFAGPVMSGRSSVVVRTVATARNHVRDG